MSRPPEAERARVTRAQVRGVMETPPYWLEGSYIPAWKAGRISNTALACGVVAALRRSPYDAEVVDEVTSILAGLGYGDVVAATWA